MNVDPAIIVSLVTLVGVVFTALFNAKLEHRITKNEQNQFTKEDRELFTDICLKVNMMWDYVRSDAFIGLKNPERLDGYLDMMANNPLSIHDFSPEIRDDIMKYLMFRASGENNLIMTVRAKMALRTIEYETLKQTNSICQ